MKRSITLGLLAATLAWGSTDLLAGPTTTKKPATSQPRTPAPAPRPLPQPQRSAPVNHTAQRQAPRQPQQVRPAPRPAPLPTPVARNNHANTHSAAARTTNTGLRSGSSHAGSNAAHSPAQVRAASQLYISSLRNPQPAFNNHNQPSYRAAPPRTTSAPSRPSSNSGWFFPNRTPDYYVATGSAGLPGTPWGGGGGGIVDYYGNAYPSAQVGFGFSPSPISGSLMAGWWDGSDRPSEPEMRNLISGQFHNVSGGFIVGGGRTHSPSTGRTATELGLTSPGFGASTGQSTTLR